MEFEQGVVGMAGLLCGAALAVAALAWGWRMVEWAWWQPRRLERALRSQGIRGSPYSILAGDLQTNARLNKEARAKPMQLNHNIIPRVSPQLLQAMSQYGTFPRVTIVDPHLVREILSNKSGHLGKPNVTTGKQFLSGLFNYEGEKWARHRRIINPAFHVEKLKLMWPAFSACCDELITKWESSIGSEGVREIDVWPELQNFTGDVISQTAFGSSFHEGRRFFELQIEGSELFIKSIQTIHIPGYSSENF